MIIRENNTLVNIRVRAVEAINGIGEAMKAIGSVTMAQTVEIASHYEDHVADFLIRKGL